MIALPRELAPWSSLLSLFPEDLAGELGRLVPRLSLAVGPMRAAQPAGGGEPDGFSGIARRGSYERLLLTEWLLADEAPEEFARRAAMGEHAFFHLARRSPVRARSSVAVFDAGPEQIGAPRLAQLAALIVLAARAERAGARFAWGILGEPDRALFQAVTPQSVLSLLGARTAVSSGPEDLASWAERAAKSGWEDAWLVGRAAGDTWRYASLEIRDVLELDRRVLSVTARPPRSPAREVELPLPDARSAVRLLRDPFTVITPPPRRQTSAQAPVSNLIFAVNGTKLFARSKSGDIIAYPVPNSPRDPGGRPKRYRPRDGGVVAAVGWVRRGIATLVVRDDALVFEHTSTRGPALLDRVIPRPPDLRIEAPQPADPLAPLYFREGSRDEVFFLDARRALYRIQAAPANQRDAAPAVALVASEVSALAASPTEIVFIGRDTDRDPPATTPRLGVQTVPPDTLPELDRAWHLVYLAADRIRPGGIEILLGDGTFEAFVGRDHVAVQQQGSTWFVRDRETAPTLLEAPPTARVVGVHRPASGNAPELVVLGEDRRTLSLHGKSQGRSLPAASGPILHVAINAWRAQLAYATVSGEVVIHSLYEPTPLARFAPSA